MSGAGATVQVHGVCEQFTTTSFTALLGITPPPLVIKQVVPGGVSTTVML
jgi:hypothetical protein